MITIDLILDKGLLRRNKKDVLKESLKSMSKLDPENLYCSDEFKEKYQEYKQEYKRYLKGERSEYLDKEVERSTPFSEVKEELDEILEGEIDSRVGDISSKISTQYRTISIRASAEELLLSALYSAPIFMMDPYFGLKIMPLTERTASVNISAFVRQRSDGGHLTKMVIFLAFGIFEPTVKKIVERREEEKITQTIEDIAEKFNVDEDALEILYNIGRSGILIFLDPVQTNY